MRCRRAGYFTACFIKRQTRRERLTVRKRKGKIVSLRRVGKLNVIVKVNRIAYLRIICKIYCIAVALARELALEYGVKRRVGGGHSVGADSFLAVGRRRPADLLVAALGIGRTPAYFYRFAAKVYGAVCRRIAAHAVGLIICNLVTQNTLGRAVRCSDAER